MDIISTRSVAALLGVSEATVKRWSDAGFLRCFRTTGGHRKFRLRDVRAFLNDEAPPGLVPVPSSMPPASPRVLVAEAKLAQDLALAGDVDGLVALVTSAHEAGRSYAATFDRVIAPGLEDIGARWACGDLSIPQEHVASLAVADMLARLRPFVEDAGARRGIRRATALCACLGDERHDLALRMVALVLAEQGYQAQVVAPVPTVDLAQLVGASGPGLVALSASSTADPDRLRGDLALLASAASAVRSRVVVGGAGFAKLSRVPGSVIRHAALGELEAELAAAS